MMCDGMEVLFIIEEKMVFLGMLNFGLFFDVFCENYGGEGFVGVV